MVAKRGIPLGRADLMLDAAGTSLPDVPVFLDQIERPPVGYGVYPAAALHPLFEV